jgi:hypothetical protein
MQRLDPLVAWAAALCVGAGAASAQIPRPRTVAINGQELVQVGASQVTNLERASVTSTGSIYFSGQYLASGNFVHGVFFAPRYTGDTLIIRRQGDSVPEIGPNVVWGSTFGLVLGHHSDAGFMGNYGGGGFGGTGLWESSGGTLLLLATTQAGVNAPGASAPFAAFHARATSSVNVLRASAIRASTSGASTGNSGVWVTTPLSLGLLALEGTQPPGTAAGVEYDDLSANPLYDPVVSYAGAAAFLAPLRGTGVTSANNRAIIAGTAGNAMLMARTGNAAAGMPAGAVFATLDRPWMNVQNLVYSGRVTGGGVGPNDDEGLWIVPWPSSTTPELVIREGVEAPGVGGGILLHERTSGLANFRNTIITPGGTIYFVSGLLGVGINNDNDGVVYRAKRNTEGVWEFTLVAREGQNAPGLTAGVDRYGPFGSLFANSMDELVMMSQIQGSSAWAVYAGRPGAMRVMVAAGRQVNLGTPQAPVIRTVRTLFSQFLPITSSASGGGAGDGLMTCISDIGTMVYRAEFNDGPPGIFEVRFRGSDVNGDGSHTVQDIFQFLEQWFGMNPASEFNGDGQFTVQDIFDFLEQWFAQQGM